MTEIGKTIRGIRTSLGLTQGQLEVKSGVPRPTITMLEQGYRENPTIDTLLKLALALNTTPDGILRRAGLLTTSAKLSPAEQEVVNLFRALSPLYRECILITLRALAQARSSCGADVPKTKNELIELINGSWYNWTDDQQDRIRDLVLDMVRQQAEEQEEKEGGEQTRHERTA